MTVEMTAPFASPMTTTLLRNPQENSISNDDVVDHRRMMTGRRFSYVNSSDRFRLSFRFTDVDREKMVEVEEFVSRYSGEEIRLRDHEDTVWRVFLETTPVDFAVADLARFCGGGRQEAGDFTLKFVGTKIDPKTVLSCVPIEVVQGINFGQAAQGELIQKPVNAVNFSQQAVGNRVLPEAVNQQVDFPDVAAGIVALEGFRDFAVDAVSSHAGFRDSSSNLTKSAVMSVGFWYNPDVLSGRRELSGFHTGTSTGWAIETNGAILRTLTNGGLALTTTLTLTVGVWHFVVLTNGPTHGHRVYLGPKAGSLSNESMAQQAPSFGSTFFTLGVINAFTVAGSQGPMAEAFYTPTELGVADITALFNSGNGRQHAELAGLGISPEAYWGMQDASGGIVDEESTNDLVEYTSGGSRTYQVAGPGV